MTVVDGAAALAVPGAGVEDKRVVCDGSQVRARKGQSHLLRIPPLMTPPLNGGYECE